MTLPGGPLTPTPAAELVPHPPEVPVPPADRYRILTDPRAEPGSASHRLQIPLGTPLEDAADALDIIFRRGSACDAVLLTVGSQFAGVVTRERFRALSSATGPHRGGQPVGAGDGPSLPGPPVQYELFTFLCPRCGWTDYLMEGDQPAPHCPKAGHGPMDRET